MMVVSRIVLALMAALVVAPAGAALAQSATQTADSEMVVTSTARTASLPATAKAPATDAKAADPAPVDYSTHPVASQAQVMAYLAGAPRVDHYSGQPDAQADGDHTDGRQIHGEMGVSIGTGGYHNVYATSLIPIKGGTLGIAVSQTDYGKNGGFYGGRYGYGFGRRGTSQSVALSLDMSDDDDSSSDTPKDCTPGAHNGDRYIEPVWVRRLNRDRPTCAATADQP